MKALVVGGVAGGASFAARLRRLDEAARIIMFERGEYVSFANCGLPYHIGDTIKERDRLIIQTPESFKRRYNVEVRNNSEVTSIDTEKKKVTVRHKGELYEEEYDVLLLSPGSAPIRPPLDGADDERVLTLRNLPDMDRIRDRVGKKNASRVVVVGGGFIGLEMAENLRHRGLEVSIVELLDQVFPPIDSELASVVHQHLTMNGIGLHLQDPVGRFEDLGESGIRVVLKSGATIESDMVVLAIGVRPDTGFLKESGVELTPRGAIVTDKHMKTGVEDVYAVGDAVEVVDFISGTKVHVPLAGPANRQGRIAADNVVGIESSYKNTQGTAVCKIFDLTAAVTGINEKNAKKHGIEFVKSYTHSASHATYYPGAYPMSIKILLEPKTGKLLGAQIVGKVGVDKRIDVFATAVRHSLNVYDLAELELAYAPPFGSAKDPVNMAGFVAQNILEGRMSVFYAEDVENLNKDETVLLDVRTREENEMGAIEGSINIPVDELRERIGELDKSKRQMVYCQVGLRGYLATRILEQSGFKAENLSGGYKTYSALASHNYDSSYLKPVDQPTCSSPTGAPSEKPNIEVDATGLQCPGPIMQLKTAVDGAGDGESIRIKATDQGFAYDVPAWCARTQNTLVSLHSEGGVFEAVIRKGAPTDTCPVPDTSRDHKTMVVFSNDMDRMMAAFIIANGAASMGSEVTLFFTFWGLNLLRKGDGKGAKKNGLEKMFGMMMPKGPNKTVLSKMHMGGMGTAMMQHVMKKKKVFSLTELMQQAQANGVKFVACTMTMDIMGIKKEELIDGVEFGGVAYYLQQADKAGYNLFI